jgi:NAD-dependent dihydropyrimidine dehydrogenase PreA subunit
MSETTFMGVERNKIDWKPAIDYAKCDFCLECAKFCPHKVFEVRENEEIKLILRNPNNCVVFCRACSKICGPDALTFPDKNLTTQRIKEIRKEESNG